MQTSIKISAQEFEERRIKLFNHLQVEGLSGVVLFDSTYILYYTGFAFIPTERPVAFVMNASGETAMFVPRLAGFLQKLYPVYPERCASKDSQNQ